jgi:cellulose synthase/poly-beta-1,6-N-acetylglucosamine synthase-like glycosyltransferase
VICDSIKSILASKCPPNEVIVIDDGSTDATYDVVAQTFSGNERVRVYRRPNGGKASTLNFAIEMTDAEVLVAIDADSRLDEEAIGWLARHFADPTIGAVAGAVHVGNRGRLIARFQALEYLISQNLDRRAFEMVNGISVVPGAIGAWRRTALEDVGGYDSDTLAEDADLTFKLERAGWKVICEPRALVRTEAPASLGPFIKQRFRWMYGMLQVAYKHTDVFRQKGARGVKFCSLPNIFLFQFLFALVSPVVDLMLVISLVSDFWNYFMHGETGLSSRSAMIAAYWIGFQLFEVGVAIIAFTLNRGPTDWSLLPLVVLQRFCYRQLIYLVAIRAATAAIRGHLVGWGKLQRFGIPDSGARAR